MNHQEKYSAQTGAEGKEETFSLEEEQLEEVTGGGCFSCFGGGQKKSSIQPEEQPGDWALVGRTLSGHRVYNNSQGAGEAKAEESNPSHWGIYDHREPGLVNSRYILKPVEAGSRGY